MTDTTLQASSIIRLIVKAAITIAVFAFLASKLDMSAVGQAMMHLNLPLFAISLFILIARNVIGAYRHQVLLSYYNCNPGIFALTRLYFISGFFSLLLPTVVGGDIARAYYLYRYSGGNSETISSVIVERALGVYAMMILSVCAIVIAIFSGLDVFESNIIRIVFLVFIGGLIVSLLFFSSTFELFLLSAIPKRFERILQIPLKLAKNIGSYRNAPLLLLKALSLSILFQFVTIISTYILGLSIGVGVSFFYYLMFLPVIWLISMLPISIGGLGVRESAYVVLFGIAGVSHEAALALGLMWFMQALILGGIGGVDFLLRGHEYAEMVQFGRKRS